MASILKDISLDAVEKILDGACLPQDIENPKQLQIATHPDLYPNEKDRATALFQRVNNLVHYINNPTVVKSPKRRYNLGFQCGIGDVADLWWAGAEKDERYLLKISRIPQGEALLNRERHVLTNFHTAAGDLTYRLYYPLLAESFPARTKTLQKRVNVFAGASNHRVTLEKVAKKYPSGLDSRHLGWLYKRLLIGIGFAHQQGVVHGAILPRHVLINPKNHGIVLCGWGQSVDIGEPIKLISKDFRGMYPDEVLNKKPAGPETDIYMATKCMVNLSDGSIDLGVPSGANMPDAMWRFFKSCLLPGKQMRPSDAFAVHEEFDELLRKLYGAPKFVELVV